MVVSFEFAAYKTILIIFSLLFLIAGIYPFLSQIIPQIKIIDAKYITYIIIILAALQFIYVFKMRRPRIY